MSRPIEPQERPSVSTGNNTSELDGQHADPTLDIRGGGGEVNRARGRAEFDQDFDDQARLREQTAVAPGIDDRTGTADADGTVRANPGHYDAAGTDRTLPNGGAPATAGTDAALRTSRFSADERSPATDDDRTERAMPTTIPPDRETVTAREKERFGGMSFGSGFFGWLTATGMAVLLITLVAAAGVALGIASNDAVGQVVQDSQTDTGTAQTVGLVGGILLLVILFVAYFSGGYVAGRMARFSGAKQGLAVWLWALITTALIAAVAAIAGSQYNVLAQLNLPRIPVDEGSVTTAGIIAIGAAILVALIGAVLGGITGTRFHRKVDAVGFTDDGRTF